MLFWVLQVQTEAAVRVEPGEYAHGGAEAGWMGHLKQPAACGQNPKRVELREPALPRGTAAALR